MDDAREIEAEGGEEQKETGEGYANVGVGAGESVTKRTKEIWHLTLMLCCSTENEIHWYIST